MKIFHLVGLAAVLAATPVHAQISLFRPARAAPRAGSGGLTGLPRGLPATPTGQPVLAPSVIVDPMGSPEVPFREDRWEFWWEFNHDHWVNLRPSQIQHGAATGSFQPVTAEDRQDSLMPALLKALRDTDDQVRSSAAFALARLAGDDPQAYLKHAAYADVHLAVRGHATLALGQTRQERNVELLQRLMENREAPDAVRAVAAVSLGVIAGPEASTALLGVLAEAADFPVPTTLRHAAAYALGLTQDPANAPGLREALQRTRSDHRQRSLLVLSLGRVADRAANGMLIESLQDSETQVRRSAAIALGVTARPADEDAIQALDLAADHDADHMVRNLADLSLGRIAAHGSPSVVETLRKRLQTVTGARRNFVTLALGLAGRAAALGDLLDQFRAAPSHSDKGATAVALALLGRAEAVPLLRREFHDTADPHLRGYLAYALGRLGDTEVQEELRGMLASETSPATLRWAAVGLALMGDAELHRYLAAAALSTKSQLLQGNLVHLMGLTGDRRSIPFLREMAVAEQVPDQVRALATYSLGLLCDQQRMPVAALYAKDHNYTLGLAFLEDLYFLF